MTDAALNQSTEICELWDREAIRDCLHRYARGVDRFDRELILSAFHPDALDEHGKFVGTPDEFVDWALGQHSGAHLRTSTACSTTAARSTATPPTPRPTSCSSR